MAYPLYKISHGSRYGRACLQIRQSLWRRGKPGIDDGPGVIIPMIPDDTTGAGKPDNHGVG